MRSWGVMVLAAMAGPAWAEVLEIGSCEIRAEARELACQVTSRAAEPVAGINYDVTITEEGRGVPWGLGVSDVIVFGGIESGETAEVVFSLEGMPGASWGRNLRWNFDLPSARNLKGDFLREEAQTTEEA